jgi:hypothetical protein
MHRRLVAQMPMPDLLSGKCNEPIILREDGWDAVSLFARSQSFVRSMFSSRIVLHFRTSHHDG